MVNRVKEYLPLYGSHALKVFSFILLIPHFTSIFDKQIWGIVLSVQAFCLWLQIVVEYGFNLSATREMSQNRDNSSVISDLIADVMGAKIFLSFVVAIISIIAIIIFPTFKNNVWLVVYGVIFAIVQGFSPIWYFMSQGKFSQFAAIDFASRLVYLILCIVFVKDNSDAINIFKSGIFVFLLANMIGFFIINKSVVLKMSSISGSIRSLKSGFSMFFFVGLTSIYTTLNLVILGIGHNSVVVAEYGTSDRIVRASGGLLDPLNRVIFAKLSYLYKKDFKEAKRFLYKAAAAIIITGLIIFSVSEILADLIISILAPEYRNSVIYLRLLLIFIPFLAINNILGLHIMIPLGMDKEFNITFAVASILSVISMIAFVPTYGPFLMGWITIFTEIIASAIMLFFILKKGVLNDRQDCSEI